MHILLTAPFLDCIQILSKVFSMPFFHFVSPAPPFALEIGAVEFSRCLNYIFWNELPKHTFLSHLPWRPPAVCPQGNPRGAQGFQFSKESRWTNKKRNQSSLGMVSYSRQCMSCCFSQTREKRHIVETVVLHPPETPVAFSHIRKVVVTDIVVRQQERAFSQTPSFQLLFMIPILVW